MWLLFLFITPIFGVYLPFEQRYVSINGGPPLPVQYVHISQLHKTQPERKALASKLQKFSGEKSLEEAKMGTNSPDLSANLSQLFGREQGLVSRFPTLIPAQEQLLYRKLGLQKKHRHRRHRRHRKHRKHGKKRRRRHHKKKRRHGKKKENGDEHVVENGPLTQILEEKNGITSLTHKFDEKLARKSDPDIDNMRVERTERINLPDYTQETRISHNKHLSPSTMAILQRLRTSGSFLNPTNPWSTTSHSSNFYQHPLFSQPVIIKRPVTNLLRISFKTDSPTRSPSLQWVLPTPHHGDIIPSHQFAFPPLDSLDWWRGWLEPEGNKSTSHNKSIDVMCASCFSDQPDALACTRSILVSTLALLSALVAIKRIIDLHRTNPSPIRLLIFLLILLQCLAGSFEWLVGWTTQLALFITYAKAIELLIICYFYLDLASKIMHWSSLAGKRLCFSSLILLFTYFTLFLVMGFLLSIEPWTDCHAPYWIWFSCGEFLTVQLMVFSFLLIVNRMNRISASPNIHQRQRRQLFTLFWVFETSCLADLGYHISLYILADDEKGCSGDFCKYKK
ncbi:unnamed protein product, partial [Mesorhabditis belari]|uniref:Uncharacterized protein n=1 Tax=Mesorhabditis belari TaxID=2138241 RepID=A0AAF3F2Z9_9BILA